MSRGIISVAIATTFSVVGLSALYAFFFGHDSLNIFVHVLFGWMFLAGTLFHLRNNLKSVVRYVKSKSTWWIPGVLFIVLIFAMTSIFPVAFAKSWYESHKANLPKAISDSFFIYDKSEAFSNLEIEVLVGNRFWFPQLAVWLEDTSGRFLKTVMVTYSTSHGVFYGGRTKENFMVLDEDDPLKERGLIRVDALPYWSHKRGIKSFDNLYTPHPDFPLADGVSGATPQGNFKLKSSYDSLQKFKVMLEVNVAFDENEYYSEFDFAEDSVFHCGAGLLGQPSLVYEAVITSDKKYSLMKLLGHGHRSGQSGDLYTNLDKITTAKEILDRIIVKYESD